ncbi:MAG: sodium transporter, partial [Rudaea sp.]
GMFWNRTTAAAALAAAIGSAVLSLTFKLAWPALPFMDRVGVVFLACAAIAVIVSLVQAPRTAALRVELQDVDYSTRRSFNVAAVVVIVILIALYARFW